MAGLSANTLVYRVDAKGRGIGFTFYTSDGCKGWNLDRDSGRWTENTNESGEIQYLSRTDIRRDCEFIRTCGAFNIEPGTVDGIVEIR